MIASGPSGPLVCCVLISGIPITQVIHVRNKNSTCNIQGRTERSLNVIKVIFHTISNPSLMRSSHFEKGGN